LPGPHVDDDGPGIPPEERERVVEPFRRVNGASGGPGSGLGLALVAQQARQHGATVTVGASPLGGAGLRVRLPARRPAS
jgi:signal transduction histidine kinase